MRPPCEYVLKYFLPQIRARIVKKLVEEHDWSLTEAARALAISPTAAAKYPRLLKNSLINQEIIDSIADVLVSKILEKDLDYPTAIEILCGKCIELRLGADICRLHKNALRELENCRACFNILEKGRKMANEKTIILENIRAALLELESNPDFTLLIPEVRTNLVMALPQARGIADVAGIPGRITVYKGKPLAVGNPEFGASKYMSLLLLEILKKDKSRRSMICIKYNESIQKALDSLGFSYASFRGSMERGESLRNFAQLLKNLEKVPDVVIEVGGLGVEPVAYVLGSNAVKVVKKTLKILEEYMKISREKSRHSS